MRRFILLALLMFAPMAYAQKTVVGKLDMQFKHTMNDTVLETLPETIMRLDVIIEPGARYIGLRGIMFAGQLHGEGAKRDYSTRHGYPIFGSCSGLDIDTFRIKSSITTGTVVCALSYTVPTMNGQGRSLLTGYGIHMEWNPHATNRSNGPKLIPTSRITVSWPSGFYGISGTSRAWFPKSEWPTEDHYETTYMAKDIILQDSLGIFSTTEP